MVVALSKVPPGDLLVQSTRQLFSCYVIPKKGNEKKLFGVELICKGIYNVF